MTLRPLTIVRSFHRLSTLCLLALLLQGCPGDGGGSGGGGAFAISTTAAPFGIVGSPYSATLATTGGTAPFTWTLFGGALPAGLTLSNTATGAITGTPTTAGNSSATFTVRDGNGNTATGPVSFAVHPRTDRVSVDTSGAAGDGPSTAPSISSDGSLVAFVSQSTNFVPGVNNSQIYVHNRQTNQIELVSRDGNVAVNAGDGVSSAPVISGDGAFVAFVSQSTNLVPGVSGQQVYLRNRQTGQTTVVSVTAGGAASNGFVNSAPTISDNGQFVAFVSNATNLVAGVNGQHIYLRDTIGGTTTLVSKDNGAVPGNGNSMTPSISSTGQFIAFASVATNLGAAGGTQQIYVHDRLNGANGTTSLISKDSAATAGNGNSSSPSISGDGSLVAFASLATNLVAGVTGQQIILHDQNIGVNGTNSLISHDNNAPPVQGNGVSSLPSISSNGQVVTFTSLATNLLNPAPAVAGQQVYSQDRLAGANGTTSLVSKDNSPIPVAGNSPSDQASANSDGSFVAFSSQAANLLPTLPVAPTDIYVRALP
ncbi:MAG TPA: putative Ig domain-containing protein [Nitrospira sp.]|nr:putative Ig domain-containing protein [Nitrospira sp.]